MCLPWHLWVEDDDGLEGGRRAGYFSNSPHSVEGGGEEGAEAIWQRTERVGREAVPFADGSLNEGGLKIRG